MTTRIISIPRELRHLLDAIEIEREKLLIIHLGEQYSNKKALGTISSDFSKFKKSIEKSLKSKDVDRNDIDKIISLIENN